MATFESINDGCHFFVMDVIVFFCGEKGVGVESNGMSSINKFLTYDHT